MFILNLIKSRYAWHSSTHGFLDIQYIVHFFIWKPMFSGYPKFEKHPICPSICAMVKTWYCICLMVIHLISSESCFFLNGYLYIISKSLFSCGQPINTPAIWVYHKMVMTWGIFGDGFLLVFMDDPGKTSHGPLTKLL